MRRDFLDWRRRSVAVVWLVLATALATALSACGLTDNLVDDRTPNHRYRLTVEVETPEGLKTGSSVIQVEQSLGRAGGAPASSQIYRKVHGEAVAVDLPDGLTLFALLRSCAQRAMRNGLRRWRRGWLACPDADRAKGGLTRH